MGQAVIKRTGRLGISLFSRGAFALVGVAGMLAAAHPSLADPTWWTNVINHARITNDFAAVNQGQVKWIARNAYEELIHLPGGAGTNLAAVIAGFTTNNNFAGVNAGQLKNLARPFYERLIAVGFTNRYPWTATTNDDVNYAAVSIGQVKQAFSFEIEVDNDVDGMMDWWEYQHFGSTNATSSGDVDSDGLSNLDEHELQSNPQNSADGAAFREEVRRKLVIFWKMVMDTPLTFAHEPGSSEDLADLNAALNALSGHFYDIVPFP